MRRLEFNSDVSQAAAGRGPDVNRSGAGRADMSHSEAGRPDVNRGTEGRGVVLQRLTGSRRLGVGLVAVIVVYAVYKLVLCDPRFLEDTSRAFRHFMKFGIAIAVYGLGVFAFHRNSQGWVLSVWHILYVGMLVLLTLMGVFDAVGGGLPMVARGLTTTLFEFLISPVPLVVLVVVNRVMAPVTA